MRSMSFLLNQGKNVLRTLLNSTLMSENSKNVQASLQYRYLLKTAVSGHDNKHTFYKTQIPPKWRYGDDACFIAKTEKADVIGIADGVGGWRSFGIDPSDFSKSLMFACENLVNHAASISSESLTDPMWIIMESYEHIINMKQPLLGSATACIITFDRIGSYVRSASIGDSGFVIVRKGRVIFRSTVQKHAFNTPFQLALLPQLNHPSISRLVPQHAEHIETEQVPRHHFHQDRPESAQQSRVHVEVGDVIVAGSDGLFDNVSDSYIAFEVQMSQNTHVGLTPDSDWLKKCADNLVQRARTYAHETHYLSPFAKEARQYGLDLIGGNPGDITVILGLVVREAE